MHHFIKRNESGHSVTYMIHGDIGKICVYFLSHIAESDVGSFGGIHRGKRELKMQLNN